MSATGDMFEQKENEIFELQYELHRQKVLVAAYQKTVNRIDDYFEYANESKSDREKVQEILGRLTKFLKETKK